VTSSVALLALSALGIGVLHTATGPDHYLPFIALARAGRWTLRRTLVVTLLCGLGHILSSVVIGLVGVAAGIGVSQLTPAEDVRGHVAGWLLIGFGLIYGAWGLRRALKPHAHTHHHAHVHDDGSVHDHLHNHVQVHAHVHPGVERFQVHVAEGESEPVSRTTSAWTLFIIFVFGPCEPLIPLVMFPAAKGDYAGMGMVVGLFGLTTLLTMTALVLVGVLGLRRLQLGAFERYSHALAGLIIFLSGGAIEFLGL